GFVKRGQFSHLTARKTTGRRAFTLPNERSFENSMREPTMKIRTALLGTTLFLGAAVACDDLPPGDVTDPYYWGSAFLKKYEDELVVGDLEPGPGKLAT